jgi:hypothetical protein
MRSILLAAAVLVSHVSAAPAEDGVFLRVKLVEPADQPWHVRIGGHIHSDPWALPTAVWPLEADKVAEKRVPAGQAAPWFDLLTHAGKKLHGRQNRAGGVAEFPNITLQFPLLKLDAKTRVVIELATAAREEAIVRRFEESFTGDLTSVLVSLNLRADAKELELASEGTARRLAWAKESSGGKRVSPQQLIVQTQFWSPQRPELNLREAEVLWMLGFNCVGNASPDVFAKFPFTPPGGHAWVDFAPWMTRHDCDKQITTALKAVATTDRTTLFNFADEIACRPPIGTNEVALKNFRVWLKAKNIAPPSLGVKSLDDVVPIETPTVLFDRQRSDRAAANRVFTWTTRFRQQAANERLRWLTESFRKQAPANVLTSSLVADHPYFGGSGLGMGMHRENATWGGYPLTLDWFGMARDRVLDVIAIEDWLGLEYMYGPGFTWEGFQLIGFQAAMMRSGGRGEVPVMTWITPSDEKNLRLKSASALCQGAKHFFYWTYGPTATSTENYWSDLRSAYDGVTHITRQLAGAEHIIAPGKIRPTRVALLYTHSSDLWQPFGYLSMTERRLTYLSLIHDQYLVDMLTEHDVESGRLKEYDALYVVEPCVSAASCGVIRDWVARGGHLYGACAAAGQNEFGEPQDGLADVFGIRPRGEVIVQQGAFDVRGGLNGIPWLDQITGDEGNFGAIGVKTQIKPTSGTVRGIFKDGTPAVIAHQHGKGHVLYFATCPGLSYGKDAAFVINALKEKWPKNQRRIINRLVQQSEAPRLVTLSHPVVEAGIYDAPAGSALILGNFVYTPIEALEITLSLKTKPTKVISMEKGPLSFTTTASPARLAAAGYPIQATCRVALEWNDVIVFEKD